MRWPVAIVLALSISPCKYANKEVGEPYPKPAKTAEQFLQQEAIANIEVVGSDAIVLERKGKPLHIEVPPQTLVYFDGRAGTLEELRPGMRVHVSYDATKKPRANWIRVIPPSSP